MRLRTTLAGGLLLFGVAGASTPIPLVARTASSPLAPVIPPQPGPPPGSCTRTPGAPDTWTKLTEADAPANDPKTAPQFQVVVDPWHPCLMYRATSRQDLQRSLDSARTWQPVFNDTAPPTSPVGYSSFAASDLQVPRQDALVMAESGNGDAMLRTDDQGHSWQLADSGLEGKRIISVDAAPSDPNVLYAVVDQHATDPVFGLGYNGSPDPLGVYVSKDGGASWTAGIFPTALTAPASGLTDERPHLAIDPDDAKHLWMLAQVTTVNVPSSTSYQTESVIVESKDSGTTWTPVGPPGFRVKATQLLAVRGKDHQLRLYYNATAYTNNTAQNIAVAPEVSTDDGMTWQPLPIVPLMVASLAVDPADSDRMVYVGYFRASLSPNLGMVSYTVTDDGWAHERYGTPLNLGPFDAVLPVAPVQGTPYTNDPHVLLQADRFGTFYLLSRYSDSETTHQALFALTPVGTGGTGATSSSPGGSGSSGNTPPPPPPPTGSQPGQPAVPQMDVVRTCNLPAADAKDDSGTLTFDGDHLLYTRSHPAAAPYTGTILRLDPHTCAQAPPLTVQFDPKQLTTVEQTTGQTGQWSTPMIDTVAYDPGHDTIWMSLAPASGTTIHNLNERLSPVFSATINHSGGATPSTVNATLRFFDQSGGGGAAPGIDVFAYDYSDDTLWSRAQSDEVGHIDLSGKVLPSCFDGIQGSRGAIATWVVGGPGRLYVQSEDDQTLWEVEPATCRVIRTFQHRNFGEPGNEDEQMACDALTFGADSDYAASHPARSVIWLRDALNQQVVAYEIPDGFCPLPTTTRYLGSAASPQRGQTRFCAQLDRRGVVKHIPNKPLVFSVGDQNIGTGNTNAAGIACIDHPMTLANGAYPVVVRFLGDAQYLPSHDTGTFPVTGGVLVPILAVALPGQPPPSGRLPEPGPAPQAQAPQAASQAEVQISAQAQSQAQSQAQAQAHTMAQAQPGVAVQRRTREQVATQSAAIGAKQSDSLLATRRLPSVAGQAGQLVAVGLMLGLGVCVRRPGRAFARLRRTVR